MLIPTLLTTLLAASSTFASSSLKARQEPTPGVSTPFSLYTVSENPEWNLRIVTAGGPSQFVHIGQQVDSPADIPSNTANFFLNSTSLQQSDGKSYLTWGTIPPYGTLFTSVQTDFTPNANLQPLRGSLDAHTEDNSSKFGFTYDGFLQLDGEERYYGLWITNGPRFGGNVAHWKSGPLPPSNSDAVAIRLKRFEPAAES